MGLFGPDFKYYLVFNNVRTQIIFSPKGWEKNSEINYRRDTKYFGLIRTWGLPLEFVLDGARILRDAYYRYGVEAVVRIEVEERDPKTLGYSVGFTGDVDFSKASDEGDAFSVMLMEAGATARIKAYEGIKYEFELTGMDVVNVVLPGVAFADASDLFLPPTTIPGGNRFIPATSVAVPMNSDFIHTRNTDNQSVNDTSFSTSGNYFVEATRIQEIRIRGSISCAYYSSLIGPGLKIHIMNQGNAIIRTVYSNSRPPKNFSFSFDETLTLQANERLFLYIRNDNSGAVFAAVTEGNLNVSYNSTSDASNCKGLRAIDLFKRIVKKISPLSPSSSYLLDNNWKNLIFTSGNAIREIPGAKIKFSLTDFYQTFNSLEDAGLGVENGKVSLELASYFARNAQSVNVGEVSKCEIKAAEQFMGSSIKLGYDDRNTEEKNGLQEYNSGQEWEMPITRVQKELNWVSAARADQFGIEKIRVEYNVLKSTKGTNDTPSDNDTFMVDCFIDGLNYKPILGSSYQEVNGLSSGETAYNLALSPKKNLLRHGSYLRSIMDLMDSSYINFASAEKNAQLRTVLNNVVVKENENVLVGSLPPKYFIPHIATISCKLPLGARKLFDSMPFGYVTFIWREVTFKGYILAASVDIAKNTEQELQLLLTQDNNLLNLI